MTIYNQGRRKLFLWWGGGWATILTNETLAETPESSPPKNKIWTKYKDLKSHI